MQAIGNCLDDLKSMVEVGRLSRSIEQQDSGGMDDNMAENL